MPQASTDFGHPISSNGLRAGQRPSPACSNNGLSRLKDLLLQHLTEEYVDEILEHHTSLTYAKGTTVFLQGAPADVVYWVRSGLVDIYYPDADGNRVMVRLAGPGEFVGYSDFVDEKGRRCQTFEAHTRASCQLALVTREHLHRILQKLPPDVLIGLMEQLNSAWSAAMGRWVHLVSLNFRQRLELILAELAWRFGAEDSRGVLILPELTHADLAEMIGSSRPMVSRLLAEMIEHGVLSQHGGHYIIERDGGLDLSVAHTWPCGAPLKATGGRFTDRAA